MRTSCFGPVPGQGAGQGAGQAKCHADTGGGVAIREGGGVAHPRPFFAVPVRVFRPRPDDTRRASGEGLDGSDPPFVTAGAVSRWGGCGTRCGTGCGTPTHPPVGVAPVRMYPCGKAPRPARGPDDQPHRAARYVTHSSAPSWSSATSAPRAPGRGLACSPRPTPLAVLVRYHTPNVYAAVVAWYDVAPGVAVFLTGQFGQWDQPVSLIWSTTGWGRYSCRLRSNLPYLERGRLSPNGGRPVCDRRRAVHPPVRAIEHRVPNVLTIRRARTLSRRGDLRGGRLRQDRPLVSAPSVGGEPALELSTRDNRRLQRPAAGRGLEVKRLFVATTSAGCWPSWTEAATTVELSLDGRLTWNPRESPTRLDSAYARSDLPVASGGC